MKCRPSRGFALPWVLAFRFLLSFMLRGFAVGPSLVLCLFFFFFARVLFVRFWLVHVFFVGVGWLGCWGVW